MPRYIVGCLAAGEYPQDLIATSTPPVLTALGSGAPGVRWVGAKAAFAFSRGRVKEFAIYTGQQCIAREVEDPALVAEIDELDARVASAAEALRAAQRDRQAALGAIAARCRAARVGGS